MNLILYYSRKGENYVNGRIENLGHGAGILGHSMTEMKATGA